MLNTTVTSHYLLFRLGADHDGSNNACTSSDNFIMASVTAAGNNQNPWKFSTCSIDYFTAYINDLNRYVLNLWESTYKENILQT